MKDKDKIIRYFEASGYRDIAIHMLDLAEQVMRGRPYRLTEFISPGELIVTEAVRAHYSQLSLIKDGGFLGAERVRVAFVDNEFKGIIDKKIVALQVVWDARFRLLTHRDVLGSLVGLGIDRKHFGDIIMQQGGAQILVTEEIEPYILQNFTKIAMVPVTVKKINLTDIQPKEEKIKEIRTTVASLRLDAVAASGFSMSRTKLVEAITAGLLQVNWQPAKGASQEVKEDDMISMRGRGRLKIEAITGTSRKGRIGVYLKRFM